MKIHIAILATLGWFALIGQFYINMTSGVVPPAEAIIRYFSYFTITTNLIVAFCSTTLLLRPQSKWGNHFSSQTAQTAITVYIIIVGIIYNLILRFLWHPTGLQHIIDELLHLVIPLLFLVYWFVFVSKNELKWNSFWIWLIYPLVYTVFIFIRGAFSDFYPYPFLNSKQIGYPQALLNSLGVTMVFLVVSLLLIAIGKWQNRKNKQLG